MDRVVWCDDIAGSKINPAIFKVEKNFEKMQKVKEKKNFKLN